MTDEDRFIASLLPRLAAVEPVIPCPPVKVRQRYRVFPPPLESEPIDPDTLAFLLETAPHEPR